MISIDTVVNGENIKEHLNFGRLYIVHSSERNIQEKIFNIESDNIAFINSSFDKAIKVPIYIKKYGIKQSDKDLISKQFGIDYKEDVEYELLSQIQFIALKEMLKKEIAVIEVMGLSDLSIKRLIEFFLNIIEKRKDKMIIIIVPEFTGRKFPLFKIFEINKEDM